MSFQLDSLDHLVLNVADVEVSAAWYARMLGMRRTEFASRTGTRVAMTYGNQKINLRPASADTVAWFTSREAVPGTADLCFVTTASPDDVKAHWLAQHVAIEAGPVERDGARGKMTSVYCRDPDGNLIEVATYPPA
ncbi:catechol 2,3-dioxygenase-like lactoylglutathione lyase family enzyme [Paraburkholderia sp. WC7.3g]|uniref:VOC family protein n=1 Tax=Paraburkholderia podalyriae TaxID=1938811 RepID=A0ABR7PR45_9BURK|nr:VOC family protein [Paraburkholderia podalyriae]MBC8748720.1 VOC family protein [Paraburkholderia podalyriae]